MKFIVRTSLAAAIALIVAALPAAACSRASVSGGDQVIAPNGKINQGLIDAAIRAEVNYHRCKAGRSALRAAPGLTQVAATHANWMARSKTVSHKSQVAGQSTLKARMSSSGVRFRAGSENIGMVHRYRIEGSGFRIKNASACQFATNAGQPIPPHTYTTLARTIVEMWANSPKHRQNMMDRKVSMIGSGAAFNANAPYCGQYFLSQNFAG